LTAFNPRRTWGVARKTPINLSLHRKPELRFGADIARRFFHFIAQCLYALTPAGSRFARFGAMDVQVLSLE
jgi:hypothetical protein